MHTSVVAVLKAHTSQAELARRLGVSPQSFSAQMKRESFTIEDLDKIADAVGATFERKFIMHNGEEV